MQWGLKYDNSHGAIGSGEWLSGASIGLKQDNSGGVSGLEVAFIYTYLYHHGWHKYFFS